MNKEYLIQNIKHWDWESYGKENKDLRYDSSSLFNHALRHGIKEGRTLKFDKNKNFLKHKDVDLVEYFNKLDNFLIIQPILGLSNRLRALASAYSICKELNKNLIINWIPDCHCDCRIEDLITNIDDLCVAVIDNINTNKLINLKIPYYNIHDKKCKFENIPKKIYVKSHSKLNNNLNENKHFNSFLHSLIFNTKINTLINSIPNINEYIGMHIRMEGGEYNQSIEAEKGSNWTEYGKEMMYKYRELSSIDNFIHQINNILYKNPQQKFYIATDMKINYKKLIDIYGNDTIKFLHRDLFDRSLEQKYYAVADIILLSKCKQFYGSFYSSFSDMVTYFQKTDITKLNIFSKDFKNPNLIQNKIIKFYDSDSDKDLTKIYIDKTKMFKHCSMDSETRISIKKNDKSVVYYYDNEWQYPVITEKRAFELLKDECLPINYLAFPWATLIDKYEKNKDIELFKIIGNIVCEKNCFTICQHIHFRRLLPIFKNIGITHLFASHTSKYDHAYEELYGIKIIPFHLYPFNSIENYNLKNKSFKYIYSFNGAFNPTCYLKSRSYLKNINNDKYYINIKNQWNFQKQVYVDQIQNNIFVSTNDEKLDTDYIKLLESSQFTLCPSGSGPNSIRLWEALSVGSIPIVLSDNLLLNQQIEWEKYIIIWEEKKFSNLNEYIEKIPYHRIQLMQNNCIELFNSMFSKTNFVKPILLYFTHFLIDTSEDLNP
jgi:hypothetical protein